MTPEASSASRMERLGCFAKSRSPNRDRDFANAKAQTPVLLSDDPLKSPWVDYGRAFMTRYAILAAGVILSAASATQVLAQAAIQEPGANAFYHTKVDLLNNRH